MKTDSIEIIDNCADYTTVEARHAIAGALRKLEAEVERLKEESLKWRRAAEAFSHKPRPQLDQRKFAKQDWWNKQLAND